MKGKFASEVLRTDDERPIGSGVLGLRFDEIEVRLTRLDYLTPRVQEWMKEFLFCRVNDARQNVITITVTP